MRSKAMSQCSGVLVTPWGKVDIAKDCGYVISAMKPFMTSWGRVIVARYVGGSKW